MKISKSKTFNHISLPEIKSQLRLNQEFTDDDSYLFLLLKAATRQAEEYIQDDIAPTTVTIEDYDVSGFEYQISTPRVNTIIGITGDTQTITNYSLFNYFNYSVLEFEDENGNKINVDYDILRIRYTSGYDSRTIEPDIVHAILTKITEMYDIDRSGYINNSLKYTRAFESKLDPYRILI